MDRRAFLTSLAAAGSLTFTRLAHAAEAGPKTPAGKIPKRRLGRTGVDVTVLALGGVAGMIRQRSDKFDPAELANTALDLGIKYFDTAPAYGNGRSEANYGRVIAHRRKEVFLATKTGQRDYDRAMREVEASLKRLQTDHVDLLQIHGAHSGDDFDAWGKPGGGVKALQKLRDQKVTRFIGVTGHESARAMCRAIGTYDFDTVLTTFNPTAKRRPFIQKVLPLANKKRMGIQAMKVMGGGLGSLAVGNPIKNDGVDRHDDARRQAKSGMLIRYALGLPITVAIVGMGSLEHLRANVRAVCGWAPLNDKQRKALEARMSSE